MSLQDWILGNVEIHKTLNVWLGRDRRSTYVRDKQHYEDLIADGYEKSFYSVSTGNGTKNSCFLLWDKLGCYTITTKYYIHPASLSNPDNRLMLQCWGAANWRDKLIEAGKELFNECGDCNCYNDFLITGECTNNFDELIVYRGFKEMAG